MELELFHGTNKDQAEEICRNKPCIPKSGSYPGDVGRGFYNFYENENYEYSISAVQAATRYADKYRDTPSAVVKTLVDFNPERVLDLNIDSNYSRLIQFKSKAQE
ncbi:hypothetical protein, partial [Weissella diestrammenae]|uniref:hypothetical protein n=2 Tax=Lactobacillales TaxID=186826 RepID=UPI0020300FC9